MSKNFLMNGRFPGYNNDDDDDNDEIEKPRKYRDNKWKIVGEYTDLSLAKAGLISQNLRYSAKNSTLYGLKYYYDCKTSRKTCPVKAYLWVENGKCFSNAFY
jgi:hypothetical protein